MSGRGKAVGYVPPEPASAYAAGGPSNAGGSYPLSSNAFSAPSGNPYVKVSSVPSKSASETFLKVLGRCGKKLEDSTKKAGGAAGNFWHHLKTSPSFTDATMARKFLQKVGMKRFLHKVLIQGTCLRSTFKLSPWTTKSCGSWDSYHTRKPGFISYEKALKNLRGAGLSSLAPMVLNITRSSIKL